MKKITLLFFLMSMSFLGFSQSVFINELHYDNTGGDIGEAVEVAGPAGTDLTGWSIALYNGSNGTVYNTINLSGTIDDEGSGFGAVSFAQAGIQNGSPDGLALVDAGSNVIQFLSYEGSLTATNGPANGQTSTDIGVIEPSNTLVGESLQLTGTGSMYSDFSWNAPTADSFGSINVGQTFSAMMGNAPVITCPMDITATTIAGTCAATANFAGSAIDVEDGNLTGSIVSSIPSGSSFPVGTTVVTLSVTDSDGNTASCMFNVTVNDEENPIVACQDITVELDAAGNYILTPTEVIASSNDNCGVVTSEFVVTNIPAGLYGTSSGADLNRFDYDPITDAITLVDEPFITVTEVNYSIAANPLTNEIYTLADGTNGRSLFILDLSTGVETELGAVVSNGGGTNPNAMTFGSDGTLYMSFGNGDINIFDIGTLTGTPLVGGLPVGGHGLTFDYDTNRIIHASYDFSDVTLTEVTTGGVVTTLGTFTAPDNESAQAMAYVGGGKIVAGGTWSFNGEIYTIDLNTLATSSLGSLGFYKTFLYNPNSIIVTEPTINYSCASIGVNTVEVIVTDAAGNSAVCTATVTVEDNIAPVITCLGEASGAAVFINEIHYDNTGADQDEAIEIAGPAGTDLSTYSLILYNGNGGAEYNTVTLSGSIDDEGNGYGAVNFPISGIQNGSPDGIVLANGTDVIQFLSYEGSFTAVGGVADGLTSTDIGVSEVSSTPIGESLQLTGTGTFYPDFTWTGPVTSSPGDLNAGQTINAPMTMIPEVFLDANGMASILASDLLQNVDEACGWTATVPVPGGVSSLTTLFNSNNGGDLGGAVYFDVTVGAADITLTGFETNTEDPGVFSMEVYAITGGTFAGNEADPAPWTLIGNATGTASGTVDVPSPATLDTPITLTANTTYAMALVMDANHGHNYSGTGTDPAPGQLNYSNTDLSIDLGSGSNVPFAGPTFNPRVWNGTLIYESTVPGASTTIDLDCDNLGETQFEITVTDDSGNVATCFATINVIDNIDPILVCQDITISLDENGMASIIPEDLFAPASGDNCAITITAVDIDEFDCDDIGTPVLVTAFASDSSGNLAACTALVTVVDDLGPEITCPADQTVDPGSNNLQYEVPDYWANGEATAFDNCTDPVTIFTQDPAPGTLLEDGTYTVTLTAEDEFGNLSTCTFELIVESILGLNDNPLSNGVVLYPNPADAEVTLSNTSGITIERAAIYDVEGRMVMQLDLSTMGAERTLNLSNLATGAYLVQLEGAGHVTTKRLIKK